MTTDTFFDIREYGARPGVHSCTESFQAAIHACRDNGGGTTIVPPGEYTTGSIRLYSHCHLHLLPGSIVKGSPRLEDYSACGTKAGRKKLFVAEDSENIAITGSGIIDAQADLFHDYATPHNDPDNRHFSQGSDEYPLGYTKRPPGIVHFHNCRAVVLSGTHMHNSPGWTVQFAQCRTVRVHGLTIDNNVRVPNSDGIHCTSCNDVRISDCSIVGGDDSIALTGIGSFEVPCENVLVTNCRFTARSSAIRVGHLDSIVRNCIFANCVITDTCRGLGVFARNDGIVENIVFGDMVMDTHMYRGHWWGRGEPLQVSGFGVGDGRIRNIRFRNISADCEQGAVVIADDAFRVEDIRLDSCRLTLHDSPNADTLGGHFELEPRSADGSPPHAVYPHDIPAVYVGKASGVRIRDLSVRWEPPAAPYFTGAVESDDAPGLLVEGLDAPDAPNGRR